MNIPDPLKTISNTIRIDLSIIILIILFYLIISNAFQINVIGFWESVSIYNTLEPGSYPPLANIQVRGDTTGGYGLGYPLIILSKYFGKFFTLSYSSLKYLFFVYSSFFIIFFYIFVKNLLGRTVSITSLLFLILNPYFIYMSTLITAQQISLTLIFGLLFFIFEFKKNFSNKSLIFTSIFVSLVLMNYIYGRYLLVFILTYVILSIILEKEVSKKNLNKTILSFLKLIFLSFAILIIFYPPNIGVLLSKNLFIPLIDGEISIFESNVLEVFLLNLQHIFYTFFLSTDSDLYFNIINGEKVRIFNYYSLLIFLIGFLFSIFDKKLLLINSILFFLLVLISLSYSEINNGQIVSTSISVYRIYILIPFLFIYVGYGVNKISNYFSFQGTIKKIFATSLILSLCITNLVYLNKSNNQLVNFDKNINYFLYQKKFKIKKIDKIEINNLENDYHFKIWSISQKMYQSLSKEKDINNDLKYIYLKKDKDLNFKKIPPRIKNNITHKYSFHIFNTLYLNGFGDLKFSYLYKTKDKNTLTKKIQDYAKNDLKYDFKHIDKISAKIFAKILNKYFLPEASPNNFEYSQANVSYFKNPQYIIIHSKDEYDFVKIKLKKRIKTILLSEFIS